MRFWASMEVFRDAADGVQRVRRVLEPYIDEHLRQGDIGRVDILLRYVPIIMPDYLLYKYTERSRINVKEGICDCAPVLNYDAFLGGSDVRSRVVVYGDGIKSCAANLIKMNLSEGLVSQFMKIIDESCRYAENKILD